MAAGLASASLFTALPVEARRFYLQFYTGGETHNFTHNEPDIEKVISRPGSALGSIGCLKTTGARASFERYQWFKAGENTISFHYYLHGYVRLQCGLKVAPVDDQLTRYGLYARWYVMQAPVQEVWQFVQFKTIDARRDAKGRPAGFPALVFKSITFISDRARVKSPYILLDNLRSGPRIEKGHNGQEAREDNFRQGQAEPARL